MSTDPRVAAVAKMAEATFTELKPWNRRLSQAKNADERKTIQSSIDAIKDECSARMMPHLQSRWLELDAEHRRCTREALECRRALVGEAGG